MSTTRINKVNSLLRLELGSHLKEFVDVPLGTLITVTRVDASIDLSYATAYLSIIPKAEAEHALNQIRKNIAKIQHELNAKLTMKYVPQLRFEIDHEEEKQSHMEEIINNEVDKLGHEDGKE